MTTTTTDSAEAVEVPDGTMLPFAEDINRIWHKRPADDTWGGTNGGNLCRTLCGQEIASTNFANSDPRRLSLVDSKETCVGCFPAKEA